MRDKTFLKYETVVTTLIKTDKTKHYHYVITGCLYFFINIWKKQKNIINQIKESVAYILVLAQRSG